MQLKIRPPVLAEAQTLLGLADATGVFEENEAQVLLGSVLQQYFALPLSTHDFVWLVEDSNQSKILGWTYFAESTNAPGMWNVWWIGIQPQAHGTGAAKFLLTEIEKEILRNDGGLVIIDTSSDPHLARAQAFYPKLGYEQRGAIPDFYAPQVAKIIFSKTVTR